MAAAPPLIERSSVSLDCQAEPGLIEQTLTEELGKLVEEPPLKKTLIALTSRTPGS